MSTISKTSPDLLRERLVQLKKLFPDLFTNEGQLNEEELKALVSNFSNSQVERYEFRWAGKSHSKKLAFTPSKATLVPDKKRSIDFDKTENMIIEGDNLEVLKLLQKSYFNKVKCIYIDPPYNTGNDFIYNDDYSEDKKAYWEKGSVMKDGVKMDTNSESVGRYHSNWLDMMQSRLLLARNLLKDDGVIFVSIDDHEVANLRKLMDEVFGEENFIAQLVWKSRVSEDVRALTGVSNDHEYIICYGKSSDSVLRGTEKDLEKFSNPDNDPRGPWRSADLTGLLPKSQRPNTHYDLIDPKTEIVYRCPPKGWRYEPKTMEKKIQEGRILFPNSPNGRPRHKLFLNEMKNSYKNISSVFLDIGTVSGTKELQEIFNDSLFPFPKPSKLVKLLAEQVTGNTDILLDLFAGSGTTSQATMELNKEDKGNRKYILVQLPELTDEKSEAYKAGFKTISDICIERVKRAGQKIKKEDNQIDTGFKVFKLTYSNFPENLFTPNPEKSEEENVAALHKYLEKVNQQVTFDFDTSNLLYEIALKDGFDLNFTVEPLSNFDKNTVVKIKDDTKEALVCLDQTISDHTVEALKSFKEQRFICLKRAVDTAKKWNLQQFFEKNLWIA